MSQPLFIFVLSSENKMKLLNKCVICYFRHLKSILNDDLFKKVIDIKTIQDYSGGMVGFNMSNKHHSLPIVYTILI